MKGNLSRMGDQWVNQFLATPMVFGFGRNLAWRDSAPWILGVVSLAAIVCFWIPALLALFRWRRNSFAAVLLGSWALIPVVVPLAVAVTMSPIYATRYAFVGLPPFLLLTAWGLDQFRPNFQKLLLLSILIATSLSLYRYATRPLKDDWRTETRFVLERVQQGELVLFEPDHEIATFLYYLQRYGTAPHEMVAMTSAPSKEGQIRGISYRDGTRSDRIPRDCTDLLSSSSGIWLVQCASTEPPKKLRDYLARRGFQPAELRQSGRIEIHHFAR
jgi:hypothetical protein